jgi:tRNA threonylcarbamoyladenosine biosynthesis protein TsaB
LDYILNIETSTSVCSASISSGNKILALRESMADRSHASSLTVITGEVMKEWGKDFGKLSAIAVSRGPGSYTGLRIGVSTAKGICYASGLPLIATDTMKIMAAKVLEGGVGGLAGTEISSGKVLLCPMIDARRMEVYTALFDTGGREIKEVSAEIIDENSFDQFFKEGYRILFFGDGAEKCREILGHPNALFIPGIYPSAGQMAALSQKSFSEKLFADTAYFEPFYLKDFLATKPKDRMV